MRFLFGFLSAILLVGAVHSQDRFALVIANGDYKNIPKLASAANDALGISGSLTRLGFKVDLVKDASLVEMEKAVERLRINLSKSSKSWGFFYYAGQGVQDHGKNFLVPVDADIGVEPLLKDRALPVQSVLDSVDVAGNTLNVVVLDACRVNPFGWSDRSTTGLAELGGQTQGTLVGYSAAANAAVVEAPNHGFAQELEQNLRIPGMDIRQVLDWTAANIKSGTGGLQVPAVYGQLARKFFLAGTGNGDTPAGLVTHTPTSRQRIGTVGPGGGLIFYNKGAVSDGWQYLEAAPETLKPVRWFNGKDGVATHATDTAIGTGASNTAKIIATLGPGTYAASVCAAYSGGGRHDWFLPSKEELDALLTVLKVQRVYGSLDDFYFWSSSERSPSEAWAQESHKNHQVYNLKGFPHLIRPIRRF